MSRLVYIAISVLCLIGIVLTSTSTAISVENKEIYAVVIFNSSSGKSLINDANVIINRTEALSAEEIKKYFATPENINITKKILEDLGFQVIANDQICAVIKGNKTLFEDVFNTTLIKKSVKTDLGEYYYIVPSKRLSLPSNLSNKAETVIFSSLVPIELYQLPSADPIPLQYYHLVVPNDISRILEADYPHSKGITGENVKVVMIDTGFYMHPYYKKRGYKIIQDAVIGDGTTDEIGHGTAIASNVLSVAPKIEFRSIKSMQIPPLPMMELAEVIAAFIKANSEGADVITNSWGLTEETVILLRSVDRTFILQEALLRVQIDIAIARGGVVLFAAGNGQRAWPGSMPEVISVGGVYIDEDGSLSASNYASSFYSLLYPFRHVPDVCGIVGNKPHGILIEMPTQPGSEVDVSFSGHTNIGVDTDGTESNDGWVVASGTSSATPQVAGVVALLKEVDPNLNQVQIKDILERTATDVSKGSSAMGDPAEPGWDTATGYGLVNAAKAIIIITTTLDIHSPTQSSPASAGAYDNPSHIQVTVEVKEGNTPITGLTMDDFTIKIGGKEATASIIDTSIPGRYVFDVAPPEQESPGKYDLEVILKYKGIEITDTEKDTVIYTKGKADVML
ncbi:MAG: hypothetical protein DRO98_08905, partial [Archaeoglobales archaeon]